MTPCDEYAGLEDADEFGVNFPNVTDLPTPCDVLAGEQEPMPNWLRDCRRLDGNVLDEFLSSRTVFYPGSGKDRHAIELFGSTHAAHCFIHVDYGEDGLTSSQVLDELQQGDPNHCKGYSPTQSVKLEADELRNLFHLHMVHPFERRTPQLKDGVWTILQRNADLNDDHGPERLAFLHIHAEAVWVYRNLWSRRRRQSPFAVLLQDHLFGGFGKEDGPLHDCASDAVLPEWLFVRVNREYWPGYNPVSHLVLSRGQYDDQERCLLRRAR